MIEFTVTNKVLKKKTMSLLQNPPDLLEQVIHINSSFYICYLVT